jgi:hypothetical protein
MRPLRRWRAGEFYLNVPSMSRCVDIAVRARAKDEILTIELKLANWRRALRQARDHLLAADRAYVCVPAIKLTASCIGECRSRGIGLLALESHRSGYRVKEVVAAPKSRTLWGVSRGRLIDSMLARDHV